MKSLIANYSDLLFAAAFAMAALFVILACRGSGSRIHALGRTAWPLLATTLAMSLGLAFLSLAGSSLSLERQQDQATADSANFWVAESRRDIEISKGLRDLGLQSATQHLLLSLPKLKAEASRANLRLAEWEPRD